MLAPGDIDIIELIPTTGNYQNLRQSVGWYCARDERTANGLKNSLCSICAIKEGRLIGYGRIVGDGHLYFYIQDVIVLPAFQKQGIGHAITQRLMDYLTREAPHNSFIGLMAAEGVAGFYEKFGFAKRSAGAPGMYMVKMT